MSFCEHGLIDKSENLTLCGPCDQSHTWLGAWTNLFLKWHFWAFSALTKTNNWHFVLSLRMFNNTTP